MKIATAFKYVVISIVYFLVIIFITPTSIAGIKNMTQIQTQNNHAESDKAVIEKFFRVQEVKDLDAFASTIHPDIVLNTPFAPSSFPQETRGKESVVDIWRNLFETFGDLRIPERSIYATDKEGFYFVQWKVNIETPTGNQYQSRVVGTFQMQDGMIFKYDEFFNPLRFSKAIGLNLSNEFKSN